MARSQTSVAKSAKTAVPKGAAVVASKGGKRPARPAAAPEPPKKPARAAKAASAPPVRQTVPDLLRQDAAIKAKLADIRKRKEGWMSLLSGVHAQLSASTGFDMGKLVPVCTHCRAAGGVYDTTVGMLIYHLVIAHNMSDAKVADEVERRLDAIKAAQGGRA